MAGPSEETSENVEELNKTSVSLNGESEVIASL